MKSLLSIYLAAPFLVAIQLHGQEANKPPTVVPTSGVAVSAGSLAMQNVTDGNELRSARIEARRTAILAAKKTRADIANSISRGEGTPTAAISQMKSRSLLASIGVRPNVELAYSLMEVGLRLHGMQKDQDARPFFEAAEREFLKLLGTTPEPDAPVMARYHARLALLHSEFLGNLPQGRKDIAAAITLQPDNPLWKQLLFNIDRRDHGPGPTPVLESKALPSKP